MGRRSFISSMNRIAREADREARARARAQAAQIREAERQQRLNEKISNQMFDEARVAQVEEENRHLDQIVEALKSILKTGLSRNPLIDVNNLYQRPTDSDLDSDPELKIPPEPQTEDFIPTPPGRVAMLFPWVKSAFEARARAGADRLSRARAAHEAAMAKRKNALDALQAKAFAHNRDIDQLKEGLASGESEAIVTFCEMVLDHSEYPAGFPSLYRIAHSIESKLLVVEMQLPTLDDVIPKIEKYKYIKSTKKLSSVAKPEKVRHSLYTDSIAQAVLRCIYEVYTATNSTTVEVVALNGFVDTLDPATGHQIKPYLISLRVTRDEFDQIALRNVEPQACLARLRASVSRSPSELIPIKPIVDFNMFDPRFIKEQDVLSELDARPNLMELSPTEFESLITNLFQRMGLETKLTQASRDGGVDCVAFDSRPVLGGKVIVQAKRYKNTVGVSAVRDLFGTVHNEGASKGILVTTSGYGKAAFEFANGKPLELISGSNLLYMLKEHCGIEAKIEMPDDWIDPHQGG